MADTSLFGRLRRLFSSDVVIRNIGGDQLKVADTKSIQTNSRFARQRLGLSSIGFPSKINRNE